MLLLMIRVPSKDRDDSSDSRLTFLSSRSFPNRFDDVGSPPSRDHLQSNDPPAPVFDLFATDDRAERPFSTLGEDVRAQVLNQPDRRIGAKADDPVDTTECCDKLHAIPCRLYGSARSLGAPNARIEIDRHDESVAQAAGLLEASDVTYVKEVETAVREDDDLASTPCAIDSPGQSRQRLDFVSSGRRCHESSSPRPKRNCITLNGALIALGTLDIRVWSGSASTCGSLTGPSTSK